jgi:hypothetical protein
MTTPARRNEQELGEGRDEDEGVPNTQLEFPSAFYDPVTGTRMSDPVVDREGDSHEKSTVDMSAGATFTYYPNRALKAIIHREVALASGSLLGNLLGITERIHGSFDKLQTAIVGVDYRPLPDSFYCPITCDLIVDPVITPDGNSYERKAIEKLDSRQPNITPDAQPIAECRFARKQCPIRPHSN